MESRRRQRALTTALFAALVTCAAVPARAQEPERVIVRDPTRFPPPWTRGRVAAIGAATTLGSYGLAVGASYMLPDEPGAEQLRIPLAGPWLALAETGCPSDDPDCPIVPVVIRAVLTGIDGVAQAGGLLVIAESAFMPTRQKAIDRAASSTRAPPSRRAFRWRPAPFVAGRDGMGLAILGRF